MQISRIAVPGGPTHGAFRGYDKQTGEVLWEKHLEAGTTSAPMTYMFDGKQYIVVAVGSTSPPAEFVALTLP
jgi:quinoprotein glucose dehydrogenase